MFRIISLNYKRRENTVWCTGETTEDFKVFMQYAIDGMNNPEILILENIETGVTYDAFKIATELYGIKKRTFEEKMRG
jgi:hypothetical protein